MTSRTPLESNFGQVIDEVSQRVERFGFRRRGYNLIIFNNGNSGLIEFQRSVKSSNDKVVFTVNLAVVCGTLLEADQPPLEKARSGIAHLRQRIGMLMPGRPDKWWEITEFSDVRSLSKEVSEIVYRYGAAFVMRYIDENNLVKLWESGISPGLTAIQRVRYLEKLKS